MRQVVKLISLYFQEVQEPEYNLQVLLQADRVRIPRLAILTIVENHGDFVQLLHQIETIPIGPLLCLQVLHKLLYKVGIGLTETHK